MEDNRKEINGVISLLLSLVQHSSCNLFASGVGNLFPTRQSVVELRSTIIRLLTLVHTAGAMMRQWKKRNKKKRTRNIENNVLL